MPTKKKSKKKKIKKLYLLKKNKDGITPSSSSSSSSSQGSGYRQPPRVYCGNNRLDTDVVNGNAVIGTRYRCFQIGYGRGYHQPVDPNYNFNYDPIDNTRTYCGNQNILPEGYDILGNLPNCLKKGFGVGRRRRHEAR
jgi:hypothetical protein